MDYKNPNRRNVTLRGILSFWLIQNGKRYEKKNRKIVKSITRSRFLCRGSVNRIFFYCHVRRVSIMRKMIRKHLRRDSELLRPF